MPQQKKAVVQCQRTPREIVMVPITARDCEERALRDVAICSMVINIATPAEEHRWFAMTPLMIAPPTMFLGVIPQQKKLLFNGNDYAARSCLCEEHARRSRDIMPALGYVAICFRVSTKFMFLRVIPQQRITVVQRERTLQT
jgi:hypothetical protein